MRINAIKGKKIEDYWDGTNMFDVCQKNEFRKGYMKQKQWERI